MEETKNVHPNKKTRIIFLKKTFCMQRTKKLKIKKNRKLDLGGGGASGERPRLPPLPRRRLAGPAARPPAAGPHLRPHGAEGKGDGAPWSRRDPDGGRGENVCIGKERRSAEDKVALAPRTWMEKKSTAGGGMLRSPADSASWMVHRLRHLLASF